MLGKNIGRLRRKLGLTQGQLAERLDVTRSSIARWESGIDIPKMAHLMELAQEFGVSVSELMNGNIDIEIEAAQTVTPQQREYHRFKKIFARGIAFATSLIILGVAGMMFFAGGSESNITRTIGVIIILAAVIVAVPFYIILGIQHSTLEKETALADRAVPASRRAVINRNFPLQMALGVGLILVGLAGLVAIYGLEIVPEWSTLPVGVLLVLVAIAVYLFIYGGILKASITETEAAELTEEQKKKSELVGKLSGATMLTATVIYVGFGLFIHSWGWLWPVFPIGALLCGIYGVFLEPASAE